MNDLCKYCDGAGTFGPLTTFVKILEMCVRKNPKFLYLAPASYIEIDREWIKLSKTEFIYKRRCPKCLGDGRLDWIEKIVGKRMENVKDVAV